MGKTKTAIVAGIPGGAKSGKEAYEEKRKRKMAEEAEKKRSRPDKKGKKTITGVGLKGGERIKVVGGDIADVEVLPTEDAEALSEDPRKKAKPKVRGKKYQSALAKIDRTKLYPLPEAIKLAKETSISNFDGTMELHLVVKKEGLSVQTELPHTTGKSRKVEVADENTIKKLKQGKTDFDVLLATPDMMPKLVAFAKLLGPKGLMPNPKTGTIIKEVKDAKNFSVNKLNLKTEKSAPVMHCVIGKSSQKDIELEENARAILEAVTAKQIVKGYLCSSMGPSVKVEIN